MCNRNLIGWLLLAADAALIVAGVMLLIAIAQAKNIFTAFNSTGTTLTTAAFVAVALGSLIAARAAAGSCTTGTCGSQGRALVTALNVTIGMVSAVLAALLLIALVPPSIPFAAPALLVMLITAGGSLIYLAAMIVPLELCAAGTGGASSTPFVMAAALAWIAGGLLIIAGVMGIVLTIMDAIASSASG